jgi:hypothetical protein
MARQISIKNEEARDIPAWPRTPDPLVLMVGQHISLGDILPMSKEALLRLLDYDRRRYWLVNGWSVRFRIIAVGCTDSRPQGVKYSFTLHDIDGARLLGFDNAHGIPRCETFDHYHRFRRTKELFRYDFRGADELICDFFAAVERACRQEAMPFEFETEQVDLDWESDDDEEIAD